MAKLTVEIGADSTKFREEVAGLPPVVSKSFKKMKEDSDGGVSDNLSTLGKGFSGIKEIIVGGGVIAAVKQFFDTAIESAGKSTNKFDENAAAVRRFGEAINSSKDGMGDFAVKSVGIFNRLGETIGSSLKGSWAAITGTWDKYLEGEKAVDRTEAGLREVNANLAEARKHAAEFNKLNEEAKNLVEQQADKQRALLPIADQRNILQQKLMEAQRAEAEAGDNALAKLAAKVTQLKITNDLLDVQKAIEEAAAKAQDSRRQEQEKQHKALLDGLDVKKKEQILTQEIADAEAILATHTLSVKETEMVLATLGDRRVDLQKIQNKEHEKAVDLAKRSALDTEAQVEIERLLAKGATGRTEAENLQLTILKLQTAEKKLQVEIGDLIEKRTTEGLTPAEKKHLTELIKQDDKLNAQIATKQELHKQITAQTAGEADNTKRIEAGVIALEAQGVSREQIIALLKAQGLEEKQISAYIEEQAAKVDELKNQWEGFKISLTRTGNSYEQQSTTALEGVRDRLKSQIQEMENDNSYRSTVSPNGKNPMLGALQSELYNAEKELNSRKEVEDYAKQYGDQATIRKYGDTLAEKAIGDLRDAQQRTANTLDGISKQLGKSGIFPPA